MKQIFIFLYCFFLFVHGIVNNTNSSSSASTSSLPYDDPIEIPSVSYELHDILEVALGTNPQFSNYCITRFVNVETKMYGNYKYYGFKVYTCQNEICRTLHQNRTNTTTSVSALVHPLLICKDVFHATIHVWENMNPNTKPPRFEISRVFKNQTDLGPSFLSKFQPANKTTDLMNNIFNFILKDPPINKVSINWIYNITSLTIAKPPFLSNYYNYLVKLCAWLEKGQTQRICQDYEITTIETNIGKRWIVRFHNHNSTSLSEVAN